MAALWQPFSRAAISLGWAELTTQGLSSPERCQCQLMAAPTDTPPAHDPRWVLPKHFKAIPFVLSL